MKMKHHLSLFILLLFFVGSLHSQTYDFSVSNESYTKLNDGVPLVKASWDDPQLVIPIGFTFHYYDQSLQFLYLSENFSFVTLTDQLNANIASVIILFGADLKDRGFYMDTLLSNITYKTVGSPGNKVLTVEWDNAGFYGDIEADGISTDFISFQLKLYEADGKIEYRFGPSSITQPQIDFENGGPVIGILESIDFENDASLGEVILLAGNPDNPTTVTTYTEAFVIGTIPEGTTYTFSRNTTAINTITNQDLNPFYFPNPCNAFVSLKKENIDQVIPPVMVINNIGQLVRMDSKPELIELDNLPTGIYQLRFQTSAGPAVQRILIQD